MVPTPWWGALAGLLVSLWQASQGGQAQQAAIEALRRPWGKGFERGLRERMQSEATTALNRRGLLDSGLLPSAIAGIEPQIAAIKTQARTGLAPALSSVYSSIANQPSFLSTLIPLVMQYGVRSPSGGWWIPGFGQPSGSSAPPVTITGAGGGTRNPSLFPAPRYQPIWG